MAKTFSFSDDQIEALQAAIEGQMGALDGASRIYLAPKFNRQFLATLLEGLKSATDAGGGSGEPVDAYTKSESDNKYLAKTDAESTYQKKSDAFTQTTADGLYLGKTAKASSATTADSATKATQDGNGNVIAETYQTKAEAFTQTTADGLYLGKTAKATAATSADSATKATQDASGNVITSTYATKTELAGKADASALANYVTSEQLTTILEGYQKVTE